MKKVQGDNVTLFTSLHLVQGWHLCRVFFPVLLIMDRGGRETGGQREGDGKGEAWMGREGGGRWEAGT